ncbi:adenine deaminase [Paenisporosarcina sp. HGH0030]|uniref:adenine deaminase n=1 Tax=Paenisporosarcina sp. HGH0030 TaxID=1078085 RepID=UPI00034E1DBE|nr:adenine deaminase [Paenisporosarcina sp. HGH0030]EPD51273.1 adenine deaminase [Paenisporosarcina sp. HGH0030]
MQGSIDTLKKIIAVSQQKQPADFILRNARVADVFSLVWVNADIVVSDGFIVAIDSTRSFEAIEEMDAGGRYVVPGLVDGHIHIESSMLTPSAFGDVLLPHGVTTVVTDPHEIANVAGVEGIQFMLKDAERSPMDIFVMLPSSVPSTSFEHAGARLEAEDLQPLLSHPSVLGLAEVMDYPAVLRGDEGMLSKLLMTKEAGLRIDGHGAGLQREQIRGYRAAGIQTDHECVTADEARDRITQGMYVLIREGSAAKNLHDLLPAVTPHNARRFLFCTDDKHLDELVDEGSIDHAIRLSIKAGMEPLQAIQLATLNAAECYGLSQKGALAAGFEADFLLLDHLELFKVAAVFKKGVKVAEHGRMIKATETQTDCTVRIRHSVHLPTLTVEDLAIPLPQGAEANIMEIIPDQIVTNKVVEKVETIDGAFVQNMERDQLKLAVIERHHQLHTIGLGIVKGFGLKKGAVATSIAHDSHNAIVLGTNDEDMIAAVQALQDMQGGLVVVHDGQIMASLALPIAGLMTKVPLEEAVQSLANLHEAIHTIHPKLDFHLFLTLSFLSLPVIPSLKLTDTGLFDVTTFQHIGIDANTNEKADH